MPESLQWMVFAAAFLALARTFIEEAPISSFFFNLVGLFGALVSFAYMFGFIG